MLSGGQEFILIIIGIATFGGVMKTAVRAKHGLPDPHPHAGGGKRGRRMGFSSDDPGEVETLRTENRRLTDQVETMQDRLVVLEKIVTDRGYTLASEIEALRDRPRPDELTKLEDRSPL
jgi:hypothetical protein